MDFTSMTNEDVFSLRDEVNAEAERRTQVAVLRSQAKELARRAKAAGRERDEVAAIVDSVMGEVFPVDPPPADPIPA